MRHLLPLLASIAALGLQGCCCCSLPSDWLPDSVTDEASRQITERGVELATGSDLDMKDGQFRIETEDGVFSLGEGQAGVDPRIPIAPFPDCPVAGGMNAEDKNKASVTFAQEDCAGDFDAFVAHFERQLDNLSDDVKRSTMSQGGEGRAVMLVSQPESERVDQVTAMVSRDEDGGLAVVVTAVLPKGSPAP